MDGFMGRSLGWGGIYGVEKAEVDPPFLLGLQTENFPFHLKLVGFFQ